MNVSVFDPYFVLIVIGIAFFLTYRNILQPSVSLLLAVIAFMAIGILTPQEVLAGFSNDKIASILLLILIAAGIRKNFKIEIWFNRIFSKATSYRRFMLQMMAQSAVVSSMINNAPVVALLTPYVVDWAKKHKISPSKLLIPLSFATITGGMLTVIGTSTTLLLNGFLTSTQSENIRNSDLILPGLMVVVTGIVFFMLIGHKLLPDHKDLVDTFESNKGEFLVEAELSKDSDLHGQTVADAGLRQMTGGYLVEIIRQDRVIYPVNPEEKLLQGDSLTFAGEKNAILKFIDENNGLVFPEHASKFYGESQNVIECVISSRSSLVGKKIKDSNFRERYDAAIVAIQRDGERVAGKIGDVRLQPGDLLLVFSGTGFIERADVYRDLYIVSRQQKTKLSNRRLYRAFLTTVATILFLFIYGELSLFPSLLIVFSIMIAFKLITMTDIKRELDLNLVAILVFSLAIGTAMINTGAGSMVAQSIINVLAPYGNLAVLIGLVAIATMLTSVIGNVGAVSICFPLAFALSSSLGISGQPLYLGLAFGASAAFMTPISYQTNLIIFGPGGYSFKDFFKVGLPMTIAYLTVAILGILYLYQDQLLK
ncbi:MAG: SLC13 family permease [Bacteroidetes bacterium]|nr:SLC13 family permease [Bacteroidota bacterium]